MGIQILFSTLITTKKYDVDSNNFAFFVQHDMTIADAYRKMHDLIKQDPRNTFCEAAGSYNEGHLWHVKCTRRSYKGIECGGGTHELVWSKYKYKSTYALTKRFSNLVFSI